MKLQHLIIVFLIIVLPMSLIMSQYTSLQIDTLAKKTRYDTALLGAAFDTMAAFQLNTINSNTSSVVGEEIRDLEAVISTFTTSLSTSLGISGVSNDYIMSYVPAMVFGLYDGYYIYAQNDRGKGMELKPYVYYTKTYNSGSNAITIAYSLDNYVTIYGTYSGKNISAAGYLVIPEDVEISKDFAYVASSNEDGEAIKKVINAGTKSGGQLSWVQYKGFDISSETIYENKSLKDTGEVLINSPVNSTDAMMYYYEAKNFTELYNSVIKTLNLEDQSKLFIDRDNDPEDENSPFMTEKIKVMEDSITKNLNHALFNYEGAVSVDYELPQLKGEDWNKILNNVSITVFLKNIPIGVQNYNNYVVVNSTTNKKYSSSKSIDFIEYVSNGSNLESYGYYHKITCEDLIHDVENGTVSKIIGYPSVDFERYRFWPKDSDDYYYYYKHKEYADYGCEVESIENCNVATVENFIKGKTTNATTQNKILGSYYTAVGRIRNRLIKASSYLNLDQKKEFSVRYYPNGGTWSKGNPQEEVTEIGRLSVIAENPQIEGREFKGWALTGSAIEVEIAPGDTIYLQQGQAINLYAVYK